MLDDAYTFVGGEPRSHRAQPLTGAEFARLLEMLIRRIVRTLTRASALVAGPEEEGAPPYLDLDQPVEDALAAIESASVRYLIAVGRIAGRKTPRLRAPGAALDTGVPAKPFTATQDGFSLNAAVACKAHVRKRVKRLSRDGLVVHELKPPFRDGITEFLFEPLDFLAA